MAVGRPSKLTPETRQRLVDAVRAGNYIDAACSHAGIAVSTYYLWREKAKGSRTGEYKELMDEIEAAEKRLLIISWLGVLSALAVIVCAALELV